MDLKCKLDIHCLGFNTAKLEAESAEPIEDSINAKIDSLNLPALPNFRKYNPELRVIEKQDSELPT